MHQSASFADRIVNIAVTGPLVRIELGVVQAPQAEGEKPQLIPSQSLVMPIEGFIASIQMADQLMRKLAKDGTIKLPEGQPRP